MGGACTALGGGGVSGAAISPGDAIFCGEVAEPCCLLDSFRVAWIMFMAAAN